MSPRISEIIQLGRPLINAVGHFMGRLDTKHTRLSIKHNRVDVRFVARRPHILRHTNRHLASPWHWSLATGYSETVYLIIAIQRDSVKYAQVNEVQNIL